jgi:thiol-disulfide isomerase/thioredoxin
MIERAWPQLAATMIAVACGAATLSSTGCGGPASAPAAADSAAVSSPLNSEQDEAKPPAANVTIELQPVDRAAFDALVAERQGKVVLVDFWATWCIPCLAQLPHTAEAARKHADDGLAVITVSLDEPDDSAKAKAQLAKRVGDAPVTHLHSKLGGGSEAMEAFEIASGSAPHYKLYDRSGTLREVFEVDPTAERAFTTEDIDAAVEKLLKEEN